MEGNYALGLKYPANGLHILYQFIFPISSGLINLRQNTVAMAKSRPTDKRTNKRKKKSENRSQKLSLDQAPALLEQATVLLHQGEPEEALKPANKALRCLTVEFAPLLAPLPALDLVGEIYVELGDIGQARDVFMKAALLDPHGMIPEAQGGGADKFFWLAQLSEEGGEDSVRWYDKGITSLRRELAETDGQAVDLDHVRAIETRKSKLSNALCGIAEVYMTDLSYVLISIASLPCSYMLKSSLGGILKPRPNARSSQWKPAWCRRIHLRLCRR